MQDELGLAMYDYGARNYDPALGRWMNIDPLAEKYFRTSPYTYVLNNPVNLVDPDGMDVYLLTSSGKFILALRQNNSATDTLYSVSESGSSITGQKNYPTVWDINDTNDDGKRNSSDGRTVRSGLIGQFTKSRYTDETGTAYTSVGRQSEQNEKDYFELFKYISDNAKKNEFSLHFFNSDGKDWIELGTYYQYDVSPVSNVHQSKNYKSYHNHSDTEGSKIVEFAQMGAHPDGTQYRDGQWHDFDFSIHYKTPYTKYVYYANSKRLYSVTQYLVEYIKKVNNTNDLKQ